MTTTTVTKVSRADIECLPNFKKQTTAGEYSSACPFCNEGDDRFRFWPEVGNYWCRICEAKGFVTEASTLQFNTEDWQAWKEREAERLRQEVQRRQTVVDRLNQNNNVERYYNSLLDRSFWYEKGINDSTIDAYRLGYSSVCPTYPGSASYTIPIYYQGKLYNIRHRLATPNGSGKYRPEMAGLPPAIFNADILADELSWYSETVIVEGEIKAMVLAQQGFGAVGIPGANIFKEKWAKLFTGKNVYIALDPGVDEQGQRIWQLLGEAGIRVHLCSFPVKPDDFFTIYRGKALEFYEFLLEGRRWTK